MKRLLMLFIPVLVLFSTCNNPGNGNETGAMTDTNTLPNNLSVHRVPDTIPETEPGVPMLLIENCGVLWNEQCFPDSFAGGKHYRKMAEEFMGTNRMISIGHRGIKKQQFADVYCMNGECGLSQVAFHLTDEEALGVLLPESYIRNDDRIILMKRLDYKGFDTLSYWPDKKEGFLDQNSYIGDEYIIETGGIGEIQENDWPYYDEIKWRMIIPENGNMKTSTWELTNFQSTNLPEPVAIILNDSLLQIIWVHREGICCPSASFGWIAKKPFKGEGSQGFVNGPDMPGGLGQPCD
ncbi:MAG: hypothetical protein ABIJ16_03665 [Bacteroidota bacterium]